MDDNGTLQPLLAQVRQLIAPFQNLTRIRAGSPAAVEELEAALKKLPDDNDIGQALTDVRGQLDVFLQATLNERRSAFGKVQAEYINSQRQAGNHIREYDRGWKIGKLQMETQPQRSMIRLLYNREVVVGWRAVNTREDIDQVEQEALTLLDGSAIADTELGALFREAYLFARTRHRHEASDSMRRVTLPEFYLAVRIALVARELDAGKPERRITRVDLPKWAFLYNVDRYLTLRNSLPEEERLEFPTGSQQESSKLGMTINGLDARQDYRTVSHVTAAREPTR